jgi:hypothetical protein
MLDPRNRAVWLVVTLLTVPASAVLWFVGAMSAGGGEIYDPPPPFFVDPGFPGGWAMLASLPTAIAAIGGFVAIRRQRRGLLTFALCAPFVLVLLGIFAILAID